MAVWPPLLRRSGLDRDHDLLVHQEEHPHFEHAGSVAPRSPGDGRLILDLELALQPAAQKLVHDLGNIRLLPDGRDLRLLDHGLVQENRQRPLAFRRTGTAPCRCWPFGRPCHPSLRFVSWIR
jgi:hypothetical protein